MPAIFSQMPAIFSQRLNSKRFGRMIIENIRENILTENNIRALVKAGQRGTGQRDQGAAGEGGGH